MKSMKFKDEDDEFKPQLVKDLSERLERGIIDLGDTAKFDMYVEGGNLVELKRLQDHEERYRKNFKHDFIELKPQTEAIGKLDKPPFVLIFVPGENEYYMILPREIKEAYKERIEEREFEKMDMTIDTFPSNAGPLSYQELLERFIERID